MNMRVTLDGIEETIMNLQNYSTDLVKKANELCKKLAELGYDVARLELSGHIYTGETIASLTVTQVDEAHYTLSAGSKALLFLEFGAGIQGVGHPLAGQFGMGAGTYPGQRHAFDPNGWWFPTDDPTLALHYDKNGQGWGHTYGNPPHMPMYQAETRIRTDIERVANEVFKK